MIVKLGIGYSLGTDQILDALCCDSVETQLDIANRLGISESTLKRRIKVLKDTNKLKVFRYIDNNFIYCYGKDVWIDNSYDAKEIAKYRGLRLADNELDSLSDDELQELVSNAPLFKDEINQRAADMGYTNDYKPSPLICAQALEFSKAEREELDEAIDNFRYNF